MAAQEASTHSILKFTACITVLALHNASKELGETDHISPRMYFRGEQPNRTNGNCADALPPTVKTNLHSPMSPSPGGSPHWGPSAL